jgi:competence ComEA-like helix-hairpin-helix protein
MTLTSDERRALAFIAGLLFLSAAVRLATLPGAVAPPGEPLDLAAHIEATARAVAEAERMAEPLAPGERIDPNTASAVELARLPRVGPALARRIVEDRERNGPFRSAPELARVPGLGPRLVELATPHLALPAGPPAGAGAAAGGVVDINSADAATLEALPGVGPVLAARIVAHRDSAGHFASPDDLLAVRGIGPSTLARFRHLVRVGR